MARISKQKMKLYNEAEEILTQDALSETEKDFVFANWLPEIEFDVGGDGVFFTPEEIAHELAVMVGDCPCQILDLCAGIGRLSYTIYEFSKWRNRRPQITAIERNPRFVEVGRKLLPEATWICMSVFDEEAWEENGFEDGYFDFAISNPPFGEIGHSGWRGFKTIADLNCVGIAMDKTKYGGIFILPSESVPWTCSGESYTTFVESAKWNKLEKQYPGIVCHPCCVDLDVHQKEWLGVSPKVELANIRIDQ